MGRIKNGFYTIISSKILKKPRKFTKRIVLGYLSRNNSEIVPYPAEFHRIYAEVNKNTEFLMSCYQAFIVYNSALAISKLQGAMAEVGVYKVGRAAMICEAKCDKELFLFDTFEGLKDTNELDIQHDGCRFSSGDFSASFEDVKQFLSKYQNVHLLKGYFPESAQPVTRKKFCFVHLDVDTYQSTKAALHFFYNRMNKGGIILSHDYGTAIGVTKAINDFFKEKPEVIIQVSNKQCLIIKL